MTHRGHLYRVLARGQCCGGGSCGGRGMMMVDSVGRMVLGYNVGGDCVGLCGFEGYGVGEMPLGMMM